MKLAIMQPYFFPYIGYYQLMNAVDEFVIYDNIEYTKKGWINRNRILIEGKDTYITLPLKKDSDYLDVKDRYLAASWAVDRKKLVNRINGAYRRAPRFNDIYPMIEQTIMVEENNLFGFILNSLTVLKDYLEINTALVISSSIPIDHALKSENKVIEICKSRKSNQYINPGGGRKLYRRDDFLAEGIDLRFLHSADISYQQFEHEFVPQLSIIDVLMFNSRAKVREYLTACDTVI